MAGTSGDFDLPTPIIETETGSQRYSLGLTETVATVWKWLRQYLRR